jgi:beta-glucosidase
VGNAIADVLFAGGVNPSGRLTFTMPNMENEQQMTPAQWPGLPANNPAVSTYTEGLFFGYRWYDQHQVAPLFPFGHGLSYTTFAYSELLIKAGGAGPTDAATLAFALGNTGALAGAEVWQV